MSCLSLSVWQSGGRIYTRITFYFKWESYVRNNVPFKRNITDMGAVCVLFKLVYRDLLAVQSIKFYDITGSLGEKRKET